MKNQNNIDFALKTYKWNLETNKILGSKKVKSLDSHLKTCELSQEETKEAKRIWAALERPFKKR